MLTDNAFCSICGKGYHMCLTCKDYARLHPWQLHTDTSEHYKIYQILHGYNHGFYEKEEAKELLQEVDLSDMDGFKEDVKNNILRIIGEEDSKCE